MIETLVTRSLPFLYIATWTSSRPSSIGAVIKVSLAEVSRFMRENEIDAAGDPIAIFSDWNGRLVMVEVGFPVDEQALARADGRVQAGWTPQGMAARTVVPRSTPDYAQRHEQFAEELRAHKLRLTGTTWETYAGSATTGLTPTTLYAELIPDDDRDAVPRQLISIKSHERAP